MYASGLSDIGIIYNNPKVMQRGFGYSPMLVTGYGLGSFMKSTFTYLLPYLQSLGKSVGKEMLRSGNEIFNNNDLDGENNNLKKALVRQGKKSLKNLGSEYLAKLDGSGRKRISRRRIKKTTIPLLEFKDFATHPPKLSKRRVVRKPSRKAPPKNKKKKRTPSSKINKRSSSSSTLF